MSTPIVKTLCAPLSSPRVHLRRMAKATHQVKAAKAAVDEKIDPFIANNIKRWLETRGMKPEQLHNRVHERSDIQAVKMIVAGKSYGRIPSLLAIAHELGLRLEDIVREPQGVPKALLDFLESKLAPKKGEPDEITDEEFMILSTMSVPRRTLTPECYYLALQMIRKATPTESGQ